MQASGENYDLIDSGPISGRQMLLLIVGALVLFLDGFASGQMNVVAPSLLREWHLAKSAMANVFAANVYGLMLGSLLVAPLADIFSRRLITLACVVGFGVMSLFPLMAHSVSDLVPIRFLHGLALGAAMPCMIAAVSDYLPKDKRTNLGVVLTCAYSFGIAAVGVLASAILKDYGWQPVFWIGGLAPLVLCPLLLVALPESPAYLMKHGRQDDLKAVLKQMAPTFDYTPGPTPPPAKGFGPFAAAGALFTEGRASMTLLIWLMYFSMGASLYFLQSWLPILITKGAGFTDGDGALGNTCFQLGGLAGGFIIGAFAAKGGLKAFIATYLLAAAAIALTGIGAQSLTVLLVMSAAMGLVVVGGQNSLNVYVSGTLYPSQMRSSGLGLALAFTRLGGAILGSTFAGFVVGLDLGPKATFATFATPELIVALALAALLFIRRAKPA